jgi:hypothetical protein
VISKMNLIIVVIVFVVFGCLLGMYCENPIWDNSILSPKPLLLVIKQ